MVLSQNSMPLDACGMSCEALWLRRQNAALRACHFASVRAYLLSLRMNLVVFDSSFLVQVYYELAAGREKAGTQAEVAIVRVEQLAPFPFDLVMRELRRYPNAEVMW